MTREEFYKLTDILNSEVLGNFMHGGEADELIVMFEEAVEHSNILEQEEPVSEQNLSNVERIRKNWKEEPISEDLEEACEQLSEDARKHKAETSSPFFSQTDYKQGVMDGAKWQKEHLWKPADGDDLPEIDREVIVLIKYNAQRNIHDDEYPTYRVGFGHRPNPNGWNGKNLDTGEVTHYEPKLYDKGGWNAPDIVYWLDIELPKEIEP